MAIRSRLQKRLVDEALDAYVDWREECTRVWDAYDSWGSATADERALAFQAFWAALEREENASRVYAGLIERVGQMVAVSRARVAEAVGPGRADATG